MSTQEQHTIIGRTVMEHGEAKQRLAALDAKAKSYANHMRIVANELAASRIGVVPEYDAAGLMNALSKCPNRDDVTALFDELKATRESVNDLSKSLQGMGVPQSA